jgi:pimeloyl-ACP methyl ester carboxylesterase
MKNAKALGKKLCYDTPDKMRLCARVNLYKGRKPRGNIIMTHGLNNDKDEDGSFVKLSTILHKKGYNTLRFDFRGHGDSDGDTEDVTIRGELIDLERSIKLFDELIGIQAKHIIVASSFGACSSILYIAQNEERIEKLVLWNPVLDFEKTFLKAITPWGKTFFNARGFEELRNKGYISIPETEFKIGSKLVQEFQEIKPYLVLSGFKIPVLTIHGTKDTSVPYSVSKKYGAPNGDSLFISHECDHTFIGIIDTVIAETVEWITMGVVSK